MLIHMIIYKIKRKTMQLSEVCSRCTRYSYDDTCESHPVENDTDPVIVLFSDDPAGENGAPIASDNHYAVV